MQVINLFGGPGSAKSTTAAGLFCELKMQHRNIELITEYAKDLVYSDQLNFLKNNQEFVFAEQNRRQHVLKDKVDIAITDSPLLLSHIYARQYDQLIDPRLNAFLNHVTETFHSYDNLNFFLERPASFQEIGRIQNLEQSVEIDNRICKILHGLSIPYVNIPVDKQTINRILSQVM